MRLACTLALLTSGCATPLPSIPTLPPQEPSASQQIQLDDDLFSRNRSNAGATAVQGFIGVSFFDDLSFTRADPMDPTNTVESDLSVMPTLGFGGHYRLFGDPKGFEGGLDATLLFSWRQDSSSVIATGGGNAIILIDNRIAIFDLGFGLYASQMLGGSMRVYGGAGPLIQFGDGRFEDEVLTFNEDAFGVGLYGRVGVEFEIKPKEFFGVGVRGTYSELDFGGVVGDVDTDALQVLLTYTKMF